MGKTKIKTIEPEEIKETSEKVEPVEEKVSETSEESAESPKEEAKPKARVGKPGKAKPRSKKYKSVADKVDPEQTYPLVEAVKLAQEVSYSKFGGSIEAHINTAVKNIRGTVSLPHLSGKKIIVLAFGKGAEESGADIIGSEQTITEIEKGKIAFDAVLTTPEWMPKLAKVARVLGPRGLMPNPKNDTVTDNLAKAVSELRGGKTEYKTESTGQVIHLAVGAVSQATDEIAANIKVLYNAIGKSKIKKITLSPTMGPGVKVQLNTIF